MKPHLALVGRAGVGKSTIARALVVHFGYGRFSWADPIRQLFAMAYDPDALVPESYPQVKDRLYEVTEHGRRRLVTGRHILQRLGTEGVRQAVDQDFWVKVGISHFRQTDMPVVNDDTRFLNEAAAAREAGVVIVRLLGPSIDAGDHPSETEQDRIQADISVVNDRESSPKDVAGHLLFLAALKRRHTA